MANTFAQIKTGAANLSVEKQAAILTVINAMLGKNVSTQSDEAEVTRPSRNSAAPAKRGRGRPRKDENTDAGNSRDTRRAARNSDTRKTPVRNSRTERDTTLDRDTRRGGKSERNSDTRKTSSRNSEPAPRKRAAPAATSSNANYSEMSTSELRAAAEKLKITGKALKSNKLAAMLTGMAKLVNNEKRSVRDIEKMAEKANVDLTFGAGRPPSTDEGLKQRILVRMISEGAFTG